MATSPSSTSSSERIRGLAVLAGDALVCALLFVALVVALDFALTRVGLLRHLYRAPAPGGEGATLARLREAAGHAPVDVVALGSSHTYRSLDPRRFAARGRSFFNLGGTAEPPTVTNLVARQFLPALRPRLVLIEAYGRMLASDGFEAAIDLALNLPADHGGAALALESRRPEVTNLVLGRAVAGDDPAARIQREIEGDRYIPGGYVEHTAPNEPEPEHAAPGPIEISDEQIEALHRTIVLARSLGATPVLLVHPVPAEELRAVHNQGEIDAALADLARRDGVPLIDVTAEAALDPVRDFFDADHLSASGVARYDEVLLDALEARGLLPPATRSPEP